MIGALPSDSATTTVKNRTAPLASLNQEQLKRNRMEDEVTLDDLSLTWTLGGGTGGPTARTVADLSGDPLRPKMGFKKGFFLFKSFGSGFQSLAENEVN